MHRKGKGKFGRTKIGAKLLRAAAFAATIIFVPGGLLPSMTRSANAGVLTAQTDNGDKSAVGKAASKKAEPVGNEICPVSGERINPKEKATYEYKGKIYNFCCPDCIELFKKNPEKYIKKMEEEKAAGQKQPSHENHEKHE